MRATYVISILMIVFAGFITSCSSNPESGPTLGSLNVVTLPWDGGHYTLDPLPQVPTSAKSRNITSRGLYHQGETVTINVAPAAGWMLSTVHFAEWDKKSMKAVVQVEGQEKVVLAFTKRPGVMGDKRAILDRPELKLERDLSPQLTSVVFIGGGFKPRSKVTITYGDERANIEVASATANNSGNIEGFFKVPKTANIPSDNIVTAKDDYDHEATAPHSVPIPSISTQPQPGSSGNKFILIGENFPASTPVTSASVASTSVLPSLVPSSDNNGDLSFKFVVPIQFDGPNTLEVKSGPAKATTDLLVVGPKFHLESSSNQRNASVNWTARGFTPGSTVMIKYSIDQDNIEVASATVNDLGEVEGEFKVPTTAHIPSSNSVSAISDDGMTSGTLHHVPNAVLQANPTHASFKSTIVITGGNFPASSPVTSAVIASTSVLPDPAPLTDPKGNLQFEFPYPNELEGEQILRVAVSSASAETSFRVLSPKFELDSLLSKRGSIVNWKATGFTPGSFISIQYGADNEIVGSETVDDLAQSEGFFTVPGTAKIPSANSVTAIGTDGIVVTKSHVVPGPSIKISPSRASFGSKVLVTGENFPASQPLSGIKIGTTRVPRGHTYTTDAEGNLRLEILIPFLDPGKTTLQVKLSSLTAETSLILTEPQSWPIPYEDLRFSGQAWKQQGGSNDCPGNTCWRSGSISNHGFSTIWLFLYSPSDERYKPYMKRGRISFEFKTSTQACCDKLTLSDSGRSGDKLLGTWSGNTSWTPVKFNISSKRPSILEWAYRKDSTSHEGSDRVWVRNVALE